MPGKTHTTADGLSRRPASASDLKNVETEQDVEIFLDAELEFMFVSPGTLEDDCLPVWVEWFSEKSSRIATYLSTLQRPADLSMKAFRSSKAKALRYKVMDRSVFRRNSRNVPMCRVVDYELILEALHDETGHRGRGGTFRRLRTATRGVVCLPMLRDMLQRVKIVNFMTLSEERILIFSTFTLRIYYCINFGAVYMPMSGG